MCGFERLDELFDYFTAGDARPLGEEEPDRPRA